MSRSEGDTPTSKRDEPDAVIQRMAEEIASLRRWLEHIRDETGDEADSGAFARDMARRALAPRQQA
jgi:hypothetical protein